MLRKLADLDKIKRVLLNAVISSAAVFSVFNPTISLCLLSKY